METKETKKRGLGALAAIVAAVMLAAGGIALADQLIVPTDSHAGEGAANVVQMTADNVHYILNATDPTNVDTIEFDLSPAVELVATSGKVWIQPDAVAGTWYACTTDGTQVNGSAVTSGGHPACDTTVGTQLAADAISQVRVVAAD